MWGLGGYSEVEREDGCLALGMGAAVGPGGPVQVILQLLGQLTIASLRRLPFLAKQPS